MTDSGVRQAQMHDQPENQGRMKTVTLDQTMIPPMITDQGRPTATPRQMQISHMPEFSDKIDNQNEEKIVARQPQSPQDLQSKANEVENEAKLHHAMCQLRI
jgi:hypothetical protein